ncbi:hypothetical protein HOG48_03680 [Candidatus Peregrinibacteria bacterium]|jgi:chromosome segregation ATPase|nr:hypothetical protein [Candidatus Peregrinibacteria bacterium]
MAKKGNGLDRSDGSDSPAETGELVTLIPSDDPSAAAPDPAALATANPFLGDGAPLTREMTASTAPHLAAFTGGTPEEKAAQQAAEEAAKQAELEKITREKASIGTMTLELTELERQIEAADTTRKAILAQAQAETDPDKKAELGFKLAGAITTLRAIKAAKREAITELAEKDKVVLKEVLADIRFQLRGDKGPKKDVRLQNLRNSKGQLEAKTNALATQIREVELAVSQDRADRDTALRAVEEATAKATTAEQRITAIATELAELDTAVETDMNSATETEIEGKRTGARDLRAHLAQAIETKEGTKFRKREVELRDLLLEREALNAQIQTNAVAFAEKLVNFPAIDAEIRKLFSDTTTLPEPITSEDLPKKGQVPSITQLENWYSKIKEYHDTIMAQLNHYSNEYTTKTKARDALIAAITSLEGSLGFLDGDVLEKVKGDITEKERARDARNAEAREIAEKGQTLQEKSKEKLSLLRKEIMSIFGDKHGYGKVRALQASIDKTKGAMKGPAVKKVETYIQAIQAEERLTTEISKLDTEIAEEDAALKEAKRKTDEKERKATELRAEDQASRRTLAENQRIAEEKKAFAETADSTAEGKESFLPKLRNKLTTLEKDQAPLMKATMEQLTPLQAEVESLQRIEDILTQADAGNLSLDEDQGSDETLLAKVENLDRRVATLTRGLGTVRADTRTAVEEALSETPEPTTSWAEVINNIIDVFRERRLPVALLIGVILGFLLTKSPALYTGDNYETLEDPTEQDTPDEDDGHLDRAESPQTEAPSPSGGLIEEAEELTPEPTPTTEPEEEEEEVTPEEPITPTKRYDAPSELESLREGSGTAPKQEEKTTPEPTPTPTPAPTIDLDALNETG